MFLFYKCKQICIIQFKNISTQRHKMDMLLISLTFTSLSSIILIFALLSLLFLSIFIGKSISDPNYPPVKGTRLNQLFHFDKLYDYQTEIAKTHRTYRILNLGCNEFYTTDSRIIEHILKTNFDKYSKGKYNSDVVSELFGEGVFAVEGEKWRQKRKLASNEISNRVVRDFSCCVSRRTAAKLVGVISEFSNHDMVFDMQDMLMRCTMDTMFRVGFGLELNCLEGSSKEGTELLKASEDSSAWVYKRYVDPFWKLKRFLNIGSEASINKNVKLLVDFVNQVIKTKRECLATQPDFKDKEDILSKLMMESKKDLENMTDKNLRDTILNLVIGGQDTSARTLSWFFYMMCKNPLVQEKIVQEVKDVNCCEGSELKADEFVANITDATLEKMHYLHAALTETLRLYPAVPVTGRVAEEDDILPDGYRVKKGDAVYYMAYAMGRMPYIWGDDAEEFKPERWIKNGIFQPQPPFKFVAFHGGPRMCLGKDFAYRQMKIASMTLLRFFRFKLANEAEKVSYRTMITLHIDNGLHLCAIPRS